MRRWILLILVFAVVFAGTTELFAGSEGEISTEVKALEAIGILSGEGGAVTPEYTRKGIDRLSAAIFVIKLQGSYEAARQYKGDGRFADSKDAKWDEGRNILAYIKDSKLFAGNLRNEFRPYDSMSETGYYKAMLEILGYKQTTTAAQGDFTWDKTLEFAAQLGLKPAYTKEFTIDQLAKATIDILKAKTKGGNILAHNLVQMGILNRAKAIEYGLYEEPQLPLSAVSNAMVLGNTVVQVNFSSDNTEKIISDIQKYSIDGLELKSVTFIDPKTVRLETEPQEKDKMYTLKIGSSTLSFKGISKVNDLPYIVSWKCEQKETISLNFSRTLDYLSATNVENYKVSGLEVVSAVLNDKNVVLTTKGLLVNKNYTLKIDNIKSIDGQTMKSDSQKFSLKIDMSAPSVTNVDVETNQRVLVYFSKSLDKTSAETISNYTISGKSGDIKILKAVLSGSKTDTVKLYTDPQEPGDRYDLTVSNVKDKTPYTNSMKNAMTKTFIAMKKDTEAPTMNKGDALIKSKNQIELAFTDKSDFDETKLLDPKNYTVTNKDDSADNVSVDKAQKVSFSGGKYKVLLTVSNLMPDTNYIVKASDICDEYGNAIIRDNGVVLRMSRSIALPAKVKSCKAISENKIEITFTKELDSSTAAYAGNYLVSNNIGTPIRASYRTNIVTLETSILAPDEKYKISIADVEDMGGNVLDLTAYFKTDLEVPEIMSISQLDEQSFQMKMSINVVDITSNRRFQAGDMTFTVDIDDSDNSIAVVTAKGDMQQGKEYNFDISKVLASKAGAKAKNYNGTKTTLSTDLGAPPDTEKPRFVKATAIDKHVIEVRYNEEMSTAGTYSVEYYDGTILKYLEIEKYEVKNEVVLITLIEDDPIEGTYDYTLVIKTQAKDIAGNVSEDKVNDYFSIYR